MRRKVLIFAANPKSTPPLRLDEEIRRINDSLQRSKNRKQFIIHTTTATTPTHLRRAILDHKPEIVHFCGHGAGIDGIAFEDQLGNLKLVPTNALTFLFQLSGKHVKCVVLNACFAEVQASEIVRYIDYVIGMKHSIGDTAALNFAEGFYDALFAGEHFEDSFHFGVNSLQLEDIPEDLTPVLKKNNSIKIDQSSNIVNLVKKKQPNNLDQQFTEIQNNNNKLTAPTPIVMEAQPMKNGGNNSTFFSKRNLCLLWLISLLAVIGIAYYFFKPKRSPFVGYYTEIIKSEPTNFGDFFIVPEYSILTNYQDDNDGNLWQIAVSSNLLFYRGSGGNVYIGKYDAIWKFRKTNGEFSNSNKIRMEGDLISRPGFEELQQTNLKALNVDDLKGEFKEVFSKIKKGYNHGVIEMELLDEVTIRRSAIFDGNVSAPRTFDYIKGKEEIKR